MLDERIEKAIIEVGARVVILDPIQAYVGANINMNNANEVRNVMAQLGRIAEKYDCAILLVDHMNKGSGNKSSYRGLGSIDFQASARSVLIVGRIKDNPQVRVMVQDKSSPVSYTHLDVYKRQWRRRKFYCFRYSGNY